MVQKNYSASIALLIIIVLTLVLLVFFFSAFSCLVPVSWRRGNKAQNSKPNQTNHNEITIDFNVVSSFSANVATPNLSGCIIRNIPEKSIIVSTINVRVTFRTSPATVFVNVTEGFFFRPDNSDSVIIGGQLRYERCAGGSFCLEYISIVTL